MRQHFTYIKLFKYIVLFISALLLLTVTVSAQNPSRYLVTYTDKNNTPYTVGQPGAFLSQRAIERRVKYNIAVDHYDLPVNPQYISGVAAAGASVISVSKWLNAVVIRVQDTTILDQIRNLPYVSGISYVAVKKKHADTEQSKPDKWKRWEELNNTTVNQIVVSNPSPKKMKAFDYGPSANQIEMIKADVLHEHGFRGEGMVIAVLDAGFYSVDISPYFDSLRNEGRLLGVRDFVNPGGNVFTENSHGLSVLSTMAANVPGEIIGTAPKASYWLLRSEDTGSEFPVEEDFWVSAAEFADSVGADIINSSLGYTVFDDITLNHLPADMNGDIAHSSIGADIAASRGILVVNSAGNSGGSSWQIIGAPADGDSVLAVGAVNPSGFYAGFSSTGPSADGRIKPDVAVQGEGTIVVTPWSGVSPGNGTSFASPVLAGAAACLWQAHPEVNNMNIYQAIIKSASQYSNPDNFLGYGIPNFEIADKSLYIPPNVNPFSGIILFPNPSRNSLSLKFYINDYQDIDIDIYNSLGQKVFSGIRKQFHPGENRIQWSETEILPAGTYYLHVKSEKMHVVSKWLKM